MVHLLLALLATLLCGWFRSGRLTSANTEAPPSGAESRVTPEAAHPLIGDWVAATAAGEIASSFSADRTAVIRFPRLPTGLPGMRFVGDAHGGWEVTGERAAAFVVSQPLASEAGVAAGTATIVAFVTVSKDGQRLIDSGAHGKVTIRDTTDTITTIVHRFETIFPELAVRDLPPPPAAEPAPAKPSPRRWTISAERRDQTGTSRWGDNLVR